MLLTAFKNDFFHKQTGNRQIYRTHRHQPSGLFALKGFELADRLGTIGVEDKIEEIFFFSF
jgi:hypothetical protein